MKRKVVELDTKTSRKERGLGDAPVLGKVAKMSNSEKAVEPVYEDLDEEEDPVAGEWLIKLGMISALLIGLIVGGSLIYFTAASKLKEGRVVSSDKSRENTPSAAQPKEDKDMIVIEDALDLVRRGLTVRYASKVNDYFRHTTTLDALEVVGFLKSLSETDGLVVRMEWLDPVVIEGVDVAKVRVHFSSGPESASRVAYLIQDTEGTKGLWKIDFDSFAQQRKPVLKQLVEKSAE